MQEKKVTLLRRDILTKEICPVAGITEYIEKLFVIIQKQALTRHQKFTTENTHTISSYTEFKEIMQSEKGFIRAFWCQDPICEAKIKEETKATTRCLPLDSKKEAGKCIYCGKKAEEQWLFAQGY